MGKFIIRNGELEGRKFRLEAGAKVVLGRERADLNFPDRRMSRRHCVLEARDDGDHAADLGSTNGTWVNNGRIREEVLLEPGDLLRVGFTELEFLGMPEHTSTVMTQGQAGASPDPNKTIAFRPTRAPPARRREEKSRVQAARHAAMGREALDPERGFISAKGKFCEACGEAIFMKEGAPDQGAAVDGLYLCQMCALIAEKQKELGMDLLPSYAKIVGGRMPGVAQPVPAGGGEPAPSGPHMEIIEEEVTLDDLGVPSAAEETDTPVDAAPVEEEASEPDGSVVESADEMRSAGSTDRLTGVAQAARPEELGAREEPSAEGAAQPGAGPAAGPAEEGPIEDVEPWEEGGPEKDGEDDEDDKERPPEEAGAPVAWSADRQAAESRFSEEMDEPGAPADVETGGSEEAGAAPESDVESGPADGGEDAPEGD